MPILHPSITVIALAALWLGGLIAIDLIETPAKFRIASIPRSSAVELGREVFRQYGRLEMVYSLVLLVAVYKSGTNLSLAVLLCFMSLILSPWLRHVLGKMPRSAAGVNPLTRSKHMAYIGLDLLKMILLVVVACTG